jgi:hypothetical protein
MCSLGGFVIIVVVDNDFCNYSESDHLYDTIDLILVVGSKNRK